MKQNTLNLTMPQEIESFLARQLHIQLLKYAAGTAICCPQCGDIMDWNRTVNAELFRSVAGGAESVVRSYTLCAKCWDKVAPIIAEGIAKVTAKHPELKARLEIIDGRNYTEI